MFSLIFFRILNTSFRQPLSDWFAWRISSFSAWEKETLHSRWMFGWAIIEIILKKNKIPANKMAFHCFGSFWETQNIFAFFLFCFCLVCQISKWLYFVARELNFKICLTISFFFQIILNVSNLTDELKCNEQKYTFGELLGNDVETLHSSLRRAFFYPFTWMDFSCSFWPAINSNCRNQINVDWGFIGNS